MERPLNQSLRYLSLELLQTALTDIDKYQTSKDLPAIKNKTSYKRKNYLAILKYNAEVAEAWVESNGSGMLEFRWCINMSCVAMKYFRICHNLAKKGKYREFVSLPEKYRKRHNKEKPRYTSYEIMSRERKINDMELLKKEGVLC